MVTCPRCGANLDQFAPACPFCHTQTAHGRELVAQQAAYQAHAAQAERRDHQDAARRKARSALIWSLLGAVTCCLPLALVGVVLGQSARSAARRAGALPPAAATAAVVLGACATAAFVAAMTFYFYQTRQVEARASTLRAKLEGVLEQQSIEQPSACALAELELLQEGYMNSAGTSIEGFACDGKLELQGERATLHDVRFRTSHKYRHVVAACLERGARWRVKELRPDGRCGAPVTQEAGP